MKKQIAVLSGDGIGPEVTAQSVDLLKKIAEKFNHDFIFRTGLIGAIAIEKEGSPLPDETLKLCKRSDAVLFGSIGDPKYDNDPKAKIRPEQGLLALRKGLGLYANIRPIYTFSETLSKSPLKPELIDGVDFVVVRELTGGIYFGEKGRQENRAFDTCVYSKGEIIRVAKIAFELAAKRKRKLTVVDKANVLETSRLWRETLQEMLKDYPDIEVNFMYVDNAAMQIIKFPKNFDVILTENCFGDILTDEASVISGSLGMLPSASIGDSTSLFEPIHGSYPQAAGKNIANPIGSMLSAAMLLDLSFGLKEESKTIINSVKKVLADGFGTEDLVSQNPLSTSDFAKKIIDAV
ncbi:3-isopropylmalate dehydrogenase [Candidatus Daviesbacteria bacterium]|nr:3-isopropylmalate dehydrogenase [Candidatus Daviesbacteria bacterium]